MESFIWGLLLFSLKIPWSGGSMYSGTENTCSLAECTCTAVRVQCVCTYSSTFQEFFQFRDDSRRMQELYIVNCTKLVFPTQAVSAETQLTEIHIINSGQVEFQPESIAVSRLKVFNVSTAGRVVFHQESFKSFNTDSPTVSVSVSSSKQVSIKAKAFASIRSVALRDVWDLLVDPLAFKLKIPTQDPTIAISFYNVTTKSLSSSAFSSSFKTILLESSTIDKIQTNAFSGFLMSNITLRNVTVNRIERGAFSDQSVIETLVIEDCQISSMAQKSVVAGISRLQITQSVIQSMAKYGAINVTVATVLISNNTFRTLGEESLNFISWNSVEMLDNAIEFMEEGAINAIHSPIAEASATFSFLDNRIGYANRNSLVTRLPHGVGVTVQRNRFQHLCDCNQKLYILPLTGHSGLSSPFQDLSEQLMNSSYCRIPEQHTPCFPGLAPWTYLAGFPAYYSRIREYEAVMCQLTDSPPPCSQPPQGEGEGVRRNSLQDDFLLLFQVKTTKGILLFLLFCVLSCVCVLIICVGSVWIHRLYKRARLVRSNLSGSFQFNSGEEKQILYGSNQTTTSQEEEPQYAEIADVHPPPRGLASSSTDLDGNYSDDLEGTTLTDVTTLPKSTTTTLPSLEAGTLPFSSSEKDRLLGGERGRDSMRFSMSETSLTDEIMMALRDKLNDPFLYSTVMDARPPGQGGGGTMALGQCVGGTKVNEDDLYCAPIYSDPNDRK